MAPQCQRCLVYGEWLGIMVGCKYSTGGNLSCRSLGGPTASVGFALRALVLASEDIRTTTVPLMDPLGLILGKTFLFGLVLRLSSRDETSLIWVGDLDCEIH